MNIEEFNVIDYMDYIRNNPGKAHSYYSIHYKREFPTRDLVTKLEPVNKESIPNRIPKFQQKLKTPYSMFDLHGNDFGLNEYFLFRFSEKLPFDKEKILHIRFRTSSEESLKDDFLEFLQETSLIGYCSNRNLLDGELDSQMNSAYNETLRRNMYLVANPLGTLQYIKDGRRINWINDQLKDTFNAFQLLKNKGYSLSDIRDSLSEIIIPGETTSEDTLWPFSLESLKWLHPK
jgi:hypothetical protein